MNQNLCVNYYISCELTAFSIHTDTGSVTALRDTLHPSNVATSTQISILHSSSNGQTRTYSVDMLSYPLTVGSRTLSRDATADSSPSATPDTGIMSSQTASRVTYTSSATTRSVAPSTALDDPTAGASFSVQSGELAAISLGALYVLTILTLIVIISILWLHNRVKRSKKEVELNKITLRSYRDAEKSSADSDFKFVSP